MAQVFVNTAETTRPRRVAPRGLALRREPQELAVEDVAPQLHPFPNRSPSRQRENPLYLRKLWNRDACKDVGISETAFYRWLQCGAMTKSGKFREFYQSLKESPSHDGSRYPPGIACRVVVTAKSGRFLEFFLETLKRLLEAGPDGSGHRPQKHIADFETDSLATRDSRVDRIRQFSYILCRVCLVHSDT